MSGEADHQKYPGVPFAYEFVLPSYEAMFARVEAATSRIDSIVTLSTTLTLAAPALVASVTGAPLTSRWLYAALVVFMLLLVLAIGMRTRSVITIVSPAVLYETWLHLDEFEFKRRAVYWAGEHFEKNSRTVYRKWIVAQIVGVLFAAEAVLLAIWAITAT
ncbi:MAG: hypothetical protein WD734_05890 [Dehalococcoidia bacterium]